MTMTKTGNKYVDEVITGLTKRKFKLHTERVALTELDTFSGTRIVNTAKGVYEMLVVLNYCKTNDAVSASVMMNIPNQPMTRRECIRVCNMIQLPSVLTFIDNIVK